VGRLTQELGRQLAQRGVTVHTGTTVEQIQSNDAGVTVTTRASGLTTVESYDGAIVAVPGALAGSLVTGLTPAARAFFDQVQYVSHHIVYAVLQWPGAAPAPWRRVLPTIEGYRCLSNFSVTPLEGENWLFYGEVKGLRCRELAQADDAAIVNEAVADLMRTRPQLGTPRIIDSYLQRNDLALCRRHVGYTRALAAFRALPPVPGIEFAGDYLLNSTVGQAHYSGLLAADRLSARIARAANTSASDSAAASTDAQPIPR
jgi:oxygen-dependent protoporphyrinogen oxidase